MTLLTATTTPQTLAQPYAIVSAGVDWLTATAYRRREFEPFHALARAMQEQEAAQGNDVRPFNSQGYRGWHSGGARFGVRADTWLCQLSADVAHARWKEIASLASNVSRLDVEVTVKLEHPHSSIFSEQHQSALRGKAGRGRRANVTLISSSSDGDSLYFGKRQSDVYGRHYDKGRESRLMPAGQLLRYEIELKREPARQAANVLLHVEDERIDALGIVSGYFAGKQIRVPSKDVEPRWDASSLTRTDKERQLRWLGSAVKPTVEKLLRQGARAEVLRALGLIE